MIVPFVYKRQRNARCLFVLFVIVLMAVVPSIGSAQQSDNSKPADNFGAEASAAADRIADSLGSRATYDLRYRLEEGRTLSWKVEHVTTTKTQIGGTTEEASARVETLSTWKVKDVNKSNGQMVFTLSLIHI